MPTVDLPQAMDTWDNLVKVGLRSRLEADRGQTAKRTARQKLGNQYRGGNFCFRDRLLNATRDWLFHLWKDNFGCRLPRRCSDLCRCGRGHYRENFQVSWLGIVDSSAGEA